LTFLYGILDVSLELLVSAHQPGVQPDLDLDDLGPALDPMQSLFRVERHQPVPAALGALHQIRWRPALVVAPHDNRHQLAPVREHQFLLQNRAGQPQRQN